MSLSSHLWLPPLLSTLMKFAVFDHFKKRVVMQTHKHTDSEVTFSLGGVTDTTS